jgi:hypothetical protein
MEGQMVPSRHQWTDEWFRDTNQLMELVLKALSNPRNNNGTNWSLLIWSQVDNTPLTVLEKTPCGLQEKDVFQAHQMEKKDPLSEIGRQTEAPQTIKLHARKNVPIHLTSVH